jgi:hypothetical protein
MFGTLPEGKQDHDQHEERGNKGGKHVQTLSVKILYTFMFIVLQTYKNLCTCQISSSPSSHLTSSNDNGERLSNH